MGVRMKISARCGLTGWLLVGSGSLFLLPNREPNTSVTSFLVVSFEVCFTGAAGLATTLLRPSPESTVKRPSATV